MIKRILFSAAVVISIKGYSQIDSTKIDRHKDTTNGNSFNIPIFSTAGGDLDSDLDQQDVSSLLMASRDVFTQFASFQFGAARYRMRGYMAENQAVMINGVNLNNLETGFSSWSSWGGLNDVTRYVENRFGVVANRYGFSGPGGYTNIDSKASSFKKGTRFSYASANRIYQHRGMLTHSTGMMQNGWAITISGSTRQGDAQRGPKLYSPGTYFNASAYYVSIDKRLNDKHLFSFTGFGAPLEQGRNTPVTMEAYELTGNPYYNPTWGYQDGKVRNSSVSKTHRPMLMLSHIFNLKEDSKLSTTVYYNFGKSSSTWIAYNDYLNPRPIYYRYLPSYYYGMGDTVNGDILKNQWENNTNGIQQVKWDDLIAINRGNLYTHPSQAGSVNTTQTRGIYILQNRVENIKNIGFNSVFNKRMDNLFLSVGLNGNVYKDEKYLIAEDLLGADFWMDYDQFAENLGVNPQYIQNNIDKPDNMIRQGDKFGYNYAIHIKRGELWGQAEYNLKALEVYVGLSVSGSQTYRDGYWANGKFPTNSKGKSETLNFLNYGIKAGATYKLSGRHYITVNGSYLTRTPEAGSMFISQTVRNDVVSGIKAEEVISADVNYIIRYPGLKFRLTYYNTQINDQTWVRSFYHDLYNNNVNLIMKDVDQNHQGVELGVEKTLFTSHVVQGALGYGQFIYTSRPTLEAWQYNNPEAIFKDRTTYLKNYRIGGSPQLVAGIGYKYNGKKFWFAGINLNYFDEIYIEPNPDRRTAEAVAGYYDSVTGYYTGDEESVNKIVGQEKLPSYFMVNLNGGKSFRISKKYYLRFNLMVNNLLNNQKIVSFGFEQLRWEYKNVDKFPNRYSYMQGITYMAMVNFSF